MCVHTTFSTIKFRFTKFSSKFSLLLNLPVESRHGHGLLGTDMIKFSTAVA